jgi:hypothetical protein
MTLQVLIRTEDLSYYISQYFDLSNSIINDFYISTSNDDTLQYSLTLMLKEKILYFNFKEHPSFELVFKNFEEFNLVDLGIDVNAPVRMDFLLSNKYMIISYNGIHELTKNTQGWIHDYITLVEINDQVVELTNITGECRLIHKTITCFVVKKNYGLLIIKTGRAQVLHFLAHPYLTGVQLSIDGISSFASIGVSVDNQQDKTVNEFFLEFIIDLSKYLSGSDTISLSRVFISLKSIKASQTDLNGKVTVFLTNDEAFIDCTKKYLSSKFITSLYL